jgi:glucokinase
MADLTIGIDIGGTKTAALIVDQQGQPRAESAWPTDATTPDHLLDGLNRGIDDLLQQAAAAPDDLLTIGLGIPGRVNQETGEVFQAVNLKLNHYPIAALLNGRFHCPVIVENDVRAAAVGAFAYLQQHEAVRHLAYVSLGTGIAAGVILDGRLYRGVHGMAGEIGHVMVDPEGVVCQCGQRGCLEAIAAGPAIARQATFLPPPVTTAAVYLAAQAGQLQAIALIQHVSDHLARAVQWLLMTYDVEKVVFGGGVTRAGAAFMEPLAQRLAWLREQSPLANEMLTEAKLDLLPADYNAGTRGAIHLAWQAQPTPTETGH